LRNTHRLIPSRYPPVGLFDEVASPEDLELLFELESWTNDRISAELGVIQNIPRNEWVTGRPQATVIMEGLHKEVSSRHRRSSLFVEGIAQSLAVHLVRTYAEQTPKNASYGLEKLLFTYSKTIREV
jgi:hypothetical protein